MDLAQYGTEKLILFLLIFVRTAGIFTLTPIFGAHQVPARVRLAVALALTIVFVPMVAPVEGLTVEMLPLALMVAREALVGLSIGFVISLVFSAIEMAGHMVDVNAGFSFAALVDPVNGTNTALAGRLYNMLAGLLFFVTNSHHLMIKGLADSFTIAPVGALSVNPNVAGGMTELFTALFLVAIRIAVPVLAAVFLADLALAIAARVVPQMNVLIVGFPLKLGVGMIAMIFAMPIVAATSQGLFGDMYRQMGSLVRLMAVH
jgi:flagellar biosynthetic protein FliR